MKIMTFSVPAMNQVVNSLTGHFADNLSGGLNIREYLWTDLSLTSHVADKQIQ